ncbi:MAG: hypothetical protein HY788_01395 [Deltaproteobacteria bacterium]|nr:hypothetical protein [Deltaproteobacteria bacterium]
MMSLNNQFPSKLRIRAGSGLITQIRDEGIAPERIRVFAGPATGPRWCSFAAIDEVIARTAALQQGPARVLLSGASAGAWRMAALACKDPLEALARFRQAYIHMHFGSAESTMDRLETVRKAVRAFISEEDAGYVTSHPSYDLSIQTARLRHLLASNLAPLSFVGFALAMGFHFMTPRFERLFWENVSFTTTSEPRENGRASRVWRRFPLVRNHLRLILAATGAVPFRVGPVRGISGAPAGAYCDGGLAEYVWKHEPDLNPDEIVLIVHHGGPLYPSWLDKKAPTLYGRLPGLNQVVTVSPGPRYVETLPDGRFPDRDDWIRFKDEPQERIRRWNQAVSQSVELGDLFEELISGASPGDRVEPLRGNETV